jgi:hypothetical protein
MTQEEIITCLIERLDFHLDNGRPVEQDYKNYIFKLFKEAYDSGYCEHPSNPLLTGDALRDILQDRWDTGGTDKETQRLNLIDTVLTMWNEWQYAWRRH